MIKYWWYINYSYNKY